MFLQTRVKTKLFLTPCHQTVVRKAVGWDGTLVEEGAECRDMTCLQGHRAMQNLNWCRKPAGWESIPDTSYFNRVKSTALGGGELQRFYTHYIIIYWNRIKCIDLLLCNMRILLFIDVSCIVLFLLQPTNAQIYIYIYISQYLFFIHCSLLHVSTSLCHPQGISNLYFAKLT